MKYLVCLMVLWTAAPFHLAAQEYAVQLLRPLAKGDKTDYSGQAKITETVDLFQEGRLVSRNEQAYSVDMKAVRETLEVDAQGRLMKASYKVVYCMRTQGSKTSELAPRDSVIVAESKDGKETFSMNGQPLSTEAVDALSILIVMADGGPTNDQIFGVDKKQAPGGVWGVNTAQAADSFSRSGVTVSPSNVEGEVRLVKKARAGDLDYLQIQGGMLFKDLAVELPKEYLFKSGELNYQFSGHFPLDTTLEPLRENKDMLLTIRAVDASDDKLEIISVTRQTAVIRNKKL